MSLYIRLSIGFYHHRKTIRLFSVLGNDAYWIPPRLWAYAAENQPDGDYGKYSAEEIALCIGYRGDAPSMLQALLQAGFLDPDQKIHDWAEYNGYHKFFAERARKAAKAKWKKEKERRKEGKGKEASIASSMLQAGPPVPVFDKELNGRIKLAEEEVNKIKLKGALSDNDRQEIKSLRDKQNGWRKQILNRK